MRVAKATLRRFDGASYRATIELPGSRDAYLAGVPVSRGIAAAELVAGRTVAVVFFDPLTPDDAMIVGVGS